MLLTSSRDHLSSAIRIVPDSDGVPRMRRLSTIAMPMLPGGRMPSVVDRAIVSTGPGGPPDGATLSLAEDGGADSEADPLANALDDGAWDSAGEPAAQPARMNAASTVISLTSVTGRS